LRVDDRTRGLEGTIAMILRTSTFEVVTGANLGGMIAFRAAWNRSAVPRRIALPLTAPADRPISSQRERKKVEMLFAHLRRFLKWDRL
jgi:hypothetical protein